MAGFEDDAWDVEVFGVAERLVDEGLDDAGREELSWLLGRYQLSYLCFGVVTLGVVGLSEALATMPLQEGHRIGSIPPLISQVVLADQRVCHGLRCMAIHRARLPGRACHSVDAGGFIREIGVDLVSQVLQVRVHVGLRFQLVASSGLDRREVSENWGSTYIRRCRESVESVEAEACHYVVLELCASLRILDEVG